MLWDTDPLSCPMCGEKRIFPYGDKNSPFLIVGGFPSRADMERGRPFSGDDGYVLMQEMGLLGLDLKRLRVMRFWGHPQKGSSTYSCNQYFIEQVIEEAKSKKLILLIGAEAVEYFCKKSPREWNGLVVQSSYFSAPCVISIQLDHVFKSTVGEVRFALRNFANYVRRLQDER